MSGFLESSVSSVMSQLVSVVFSLAFKIVLYLIWLIFCFEVFCLMQSVRYFLLSGVMSDLVCVRPLRRFRLSKSVVVLGMFFKVIYIHVYVGQCLVSSELSLVSARVWSTFRRYV